MAVVLVVDDDAAIRETVRFLLEDEGYDVEEAPHGLRALDQLRRASDPRIVLLDLMMPILDGFGVLRAVRAGEDALARHAYIVCTAHGSSLPIEADHLGIGRDVPLIAKPFDLTRLLNRIAEASARLSALAETEEPLRSSKCAPAEGE